MHRLKSRAIALVIPPPLRRVIRSLVNAVRNAKTLGLDEGVIEQLVTNETTREQYTETIIVKRTSPYYYSSTVPRELITFLDITKLTS